MKLTCARLPWYGAEKHVLGNRQSNNPFSAPSPPLLFLQVLTPDLTWHDFDYEAVEDPCAEALCKAHAKCFNADGAFVSSAVSPHFKKLLG